MRRFNRRHNARIRLHHDGALASSARNGVWAPPHADRIRKAVRSILDRQLADGGFSIYPHGPADVNASIKAYFALKLAGSRSERSPHGAAARTHSGSRRAAGRQQLRSYQPEPVRAVPPGSVSLHSARIDSFAGQADLSDVLVDARHPDCAGDCPLGDPKKPVPAASPSTSSILPARRFG